MINIKNLNQNKELLRFILDERTLHYPEKLQYFATRGKRTLELYTILAKGGFLTEKSTDVEYNIERYGGYVEDWNDDVKFIFRIVENQPNGDYKYAMSFTINELRDIILENY